LVGQEPCDPREGIELVGSWLAPEGQKRGQHLPGRYESRLTQGYRLLEAKLVAKVEDSGCRGGFRTLFKRLRENPSYRIAGLDSHAYRDLGEWPQAVRQGGLQESVGQRVPFGQAGEPRQGFLGCLLVTHWPQFSDIWTWLSISLDRWRI
jgi:hypothetical protein